MAEITQTSLAKLLDRLYQDYTKTETQRDQRYSSGLSDLAGVTGLFGPSYGAGMEKAAIAGAQSSLIGRGLGGTTRMGAASGGIKAEFEDLRRGKIAEAMTRTADYKRTFPESTATAGILSHLATGGFSASVDAPPTTTGYTLGPMASQGLDIFGKPMYSGGDVSAPDFRLPTTTNTGSSGTTINTGSSGTIQSPAQPTGYHAPEQYDPSMVGKSTWAQQGSQISPTGSIPIAKGYDTTGWSDAEKKAWAEYVPGVSGYNVPASKGQQKIIQ